MGALRFMFYPDFEKITARRAGRAGARVFFHLRRPGHAAYSNPAMDLKQVAIVSVLANTVISLLAGLVMFPIVFANGIDPARGPGLVFVSLPLSFAKMPFGTAAAAAFFVLLFVAAWSSAISMLEIVVAILVHRGHWRRARAGGGCLLRCGHCYGAVVQPLGALASARGIRRICHGYRLRSDRLSHVQRAATAGRTEDRCVRCVGCIGAVTSGRTSTGRGARTRSASNSSLHGPFGYSAGDTRAGVDLIADTSKCRGGEARLAEIAKRPPLSRLILMPSMAGQTLPNSDRWNETALQEGCG